MSKKDEIPVYTTSNGCPVMDPYASQRIGKHGPLLLQDHHLIGLLAHFDRERTPERVVHAKGSGAHGYFEVTDDVSDLTTADFLSQVGKKTKTFTRFSTVGGEKGTPDAARDPRRFSTKFYTEEGVIDWVYNNTPGFLSEILQSFQCSFIRKKEILKLTCEMLQCFGIIFLRIKNVHIRS